jgi:hypothetical protein
MSEVFIFHTTKLRAVKLKLAPAATIALKRDGNDFVYGVTLCSKSNNFSKKSGREIAIGRMNQEFRRTPIPQDFLDHEKEIGPKVMCRIFTVQLGQSITRKSKVWKKKITKFNQGAKVVSINTPIENPETTDQSVA